MEILLLFFVIFNYFNGLNCGGDPRSLTQDKGLIVQGQAIDVLSNFSARVLDELQEVSDTFSNLTKTHDDVDFEALQGDKIEEQNFWKDKTRRDLKKAFDKLVSELTTIFEVDEAVTAAILSDTPIMAVGNAEKVKEFLKTAQFVYESAINVLDGKSSELVIRLMNKKQAERIKFNLGGC